MNLRTHNPYGKVTTTTDFPTPPVSPRPRDQLSLDVSVGPSASPQAPSSSPQTHRGVFGQGESPSTPRHRIMPNSAQYKSPGSGFMSAAQRGTVLHHEMSQPSPQLSPSPMNPSPSPHLHPYGNYMVSGRTPTPQSSTPLIRVGGAPVPIVAKQNFTAAPLLPHQTLQHRANSTPVHTTAIATSFPKQPCPSHSPLQKPAIVGPNPTVQVGFRQSHVAGPGQYTPSIPQGLGSFPPTATVTIGSRPPATPPRQASTPIVQVGTSGSKRAPNSSFPSYTGDTSVPERSLSLSISVMETLEPPFHPPPPVATAAPPSPSPLSHHAATSSPKPTAVAAAPSTPPNDKVKKSKKTPKSCDKLKRAASRNESPECCAAVEEKLEAPQTPQPQQQQQTAKQETPHTKKGNRSTPESKKTTPGETPPSRNKKPRLPPSNRASPNSQLAAETQRTPGGDEPVNATLQAVPVSLRHADHVVFFYSLRHPTDEQLYPLGHMVCQRLKQLYFGRRTPGYQNYRIAVSRGLREHGNPDHPVTPRAAARVSKRCFDDVCSEWRRTLHQWDHSPLGSRSQGLPTLIDLGLEPESNREISFDDPQRAAEYATLDYPNRGSTPKGNEQVDEVEAPTELGLGALGELSVVGHPLQGQNSQDAASLLEDDLHLELEMMKPPQ